MYAWWFVTRSLGVVVVVVVYCCRLWLPVEADGYHCTGTADPGNQFFKCTAMTTSENSNRTGSNQTVIDYTSNQTGPDVSIDADRTLLVNLKVQNVTAVHVSSVQIRSRGRIRRVLKVTDKMSFKRKNAFMLVKNRIRCAKKTTINTI